MFLDIRYAVRTLLKSPLFLLVAVVTLAVGIASTTTVFSIVNATLLQPLRYGHPDRMVLVWMKFRRNGRIGFGNPSAQVYLDWRERAKSFEQLAAIADKGFDLRGNPAIRIGAAEATANYFSAVDVQPALGRVFSEDEARSGAPVLVLSNTLWKNHFASDPNILGKTVVLSGAPWTVIGVMPQGFTFIRNHDVWIPMDLEENRLSGHNSLMIVGRLRPGVSLGQADAEMDTLQHQIARELPDVAASSFTSAGVMPLRDLLLGSGVRQMMMLLLGAVGFVLLIACGNIANLLLARGAGRQKEIAMRLALGAGRSRIVRQLLVEAAVLAAGGAAAGLVLAFWGVDSLAKLSFLQAPGAPPVRVDFTVLAFVAGVALLTLLVSGLVPAWQTSQVAPLESLKLTGRSGSTGLHGSKTRATLVVAEVALSVMLLAGGGLLVRRFISLLQVQPGFDASHLLSMDISRAGKPSPEANRAFYEQALQRVRAIPGVESADVATTLPMLGWNYGIPYRKPEQPKQAIQRQFASLNVVSSGYFQTLRVPVARGRSFNDQDTASSLPVVIIDQHLARQLFADANPVGKTLVVATPFDYQAETMRQIVGVAADVKDSDIENHSSDDIYLPFAQFPVPWQYLVVRSGNDPTALTGNIRAAVATVDQDQPLEDIATMQHRVDDSLSSSRFAASLLGGFALLSLLLAALGIYGVIAYTTAQRTPEFGLRMALGAHPRALLRLVVQGGIKLALIGGAIGLAAAIAVARLLSSAAAGVNTKDPWAFAAAVALILGAALLASWIPARRAAKVDPMIALRYE